MGSRRAAFGDRPSAATGAVLSGALGVLSLLLVGCGGGDGTSSTTPQPDSSDAAASGTSAVATSAPTAQASPTASSGVAPGSPGSGDSPTQVVTGTGGATGKGAPVPWSVPPTPRLTNPPKAASGSAKLTILLDNGFGVRTTWTLTCEPAGGTHPDPALACGVLGANGAKALPEPAPDTACTEQYGGPQKVKLTGTWRGTAVNSQLSLENGCQIARWEALLGLLPPGGITG